MDSQETLEIEYRLKRKEYEEKEEDLYRQRDKAISVIEEVQERSHYYLNKISQDNEIHKQGFKQTEHLKDDIFDLTSENLKELSRKIEDLEEEYYHNLRKLNRK